jgi:hypothetical protein
MGLPFLLAALRLHLCSQRLEGVMKHRHLSIAVGGTAIS